MKLSAPLSALLFSVAIPVALQAGTRQSPPNVVLIYVDDLGYSDVGFNGHCPYQTPNIDRLAGEGMIFTNAYSNGPNCAPSRACLLSGQLTPRHGIFTVGNPDRGPVRQRRLIASPNKTDLPLRIATIAEMFQAAGYRTGHFGKWHLGEPGTGGPLEQGFDVNIGGNHSGQPQGGYFAPYRNPQLADPQSPDPPAPNQPAREGEYLTDRLTQEAIRFLRTNDQKPFFVYLAHYAVHTPIQAPQDITEKYREAAGRAGFNPEYAAMIERVDQSVGEVLLELETLNLAHHTLVIFYSDNGGNGSITSNAPLRGSKGMLYEGGIRVPLAVHWQGTIAAGSRCDVPVSGVDFFETFRVMLGAKPPQGQPLDGADLMALWTGQSLALDRGPLFWHFPAYLEGRNAAGAADRQFRTRPAAAVRDGDWKLIEYFEDGRQELYNLATDAGEAHNLADREPQRKEQLARVLHEWQTNIKAPIPNQANPQYGGD